MKLIFFKPCKSVKEQEDGTFLIDGIFHGLSPRKFPVSFPPSDLAIEFEAEEGELGKVMEFRVSICDPKELIIWEMEAEFMFADSIDGLAPRHWCSITMESRPMIEMPGVYQFLVKSNGKLLGSERIAFLVNK